MKTLILIGILVTFMIFGQAENELENEKPEFINFTIHNNSVNRNHFYVVGPKPNGRKFSYGFPMMPFFKRKEYWTTGTKVYKVNRFGLSKLLITIKPEDENTVVKLFKEITYLNHGTCYGFFIFII